jgi:hypothetical protein
MYSSTPTFGTVFEKNLRAMWARCTDSGCAPAPMSWIVTGSSWPASGGASTVGWWFSFSAGMGVAGLDAVLRCARISWFSLPPGVAGRDSGGVAGTSPAAFARAVMERTINFMAVSRDMLSTSSSSSLAGGDGASWRLRLLNSGKTPASPAGLGAEGGSIVVWFCMTGTRTSRLGCTVLSGGVE